MKVERLSKAMSGLALMRTAERIQQQQQQNEKIIQNPNMQRGSN